jgi:antitoxin component YwqK of YwqJK toxin-antitoxin module
MKKLTFSIICILVSRIALSQNETNGTITFDHCLCNSSNAVDIVYDTISLHRQCAVISVSCNLLLNNKYVKYCMKKDKNSNLYLIDGIMRITSRHDSMYFINAVYEKGVLNSFRISRPDYGDESYEVKNNLFDGKYNFYKNGKLFKSGFFTMGLKDSIWTDYYSNMSIKSIGRFMAKRITITYDNNTGNLYEIQNFSDTLSINSFSKYNELVKKYNYDDGGVVNFPITIEFKVGEWNYYDDSGTLKSKEFYENSTRIKNKN